MPPGSIARRSLAFKASLAFVVYKIAAPRRGKNGMTSAQARRQPSSKAVSALSRRRRPRDKSP
jgi:hypothetical protein